MKKKKGFVLAYTVIIMGIVFVVMAVLVAVVASQKGVDKQTINKFESDMFIVQQQYNFDNLTYQNYSEYLTNLSTDKQVEQDFTTYYMQNYIIELKLDYSQIRVYNVDKAKLLYQKDR